MLKTDHLLGKKHVSQNKKKKEGKALSSNLEKVNLPLMFYCMLSNKQIIIY